MSPAPLPSPQNPSTSDLQLRTRPVQIAFAFLLGVAATLIGVRLAGGRFTQPTEFDPRSLAPYRVDLNRADIGELRQLPGVGATKAERLVEARPYETEDDLRKVPGFGPLTAQRLLPHVTIGEPKISTSAKVPTGLVNPNTASPEELQRLPGVGAKMAQRSHR
ncbi:MAG: ComEA family DNA-binding protein [Gemmataceae bacterium]